MADVTSVQWATADDYSTYLEFYPELHLQRPPLSKEVWLKDLAPHTVFLESGAEKVAYVYLEIYNPVGYLRHVVVQPNHRRRGFGKAIMRAVASHLHNAGCTEWRLNCFRNNTAGLALYASAGLRIAHPSVLLTFPWRAIPALQSGGPPGEVSLVQPREDSWLEDTFDLPRGQLARLRSLSDMMLLKLVAALADSSANASSDVGSNEGWAGKPRANHFDVGQSLGPIKSGQVLPGAVKSDKIGKGAVSSGEAEQWRGLSTADVAADLAQPDVSTSSIPSPALQPSGESETSRGTSLQGRSGGHGESALEVDSQKSEVEELGESFRSLDASISGITGRSSDDRQGDATSSGSRDHFVTTHPRRLCATGLMCFNMAQQQCWVFKAIDASKARELLFWLESQLPHKGPTISLMLEGGGPAIEALQTLGEAECELYHLRGKLP